ncbi:MAG TPA: DNA recombination protein RmuC, partial [Longimicrobiaceae bacterium]|nr:DNA recombination protein RmuC [Longimicrobiaceae bacterium]
MSPTLLAEVAIALLVIAIAMLGMLLRRTGTADLAPLAARLDGAAQAQERGERLLRDEMGRSRDEAASRATALRGEVAASVQAASTSTVTFLGELSQSQQTHLTGMMTALQQMTEAEQNRSHALRGELNGSLKTFGENVGRYLTQLAEMERAGLDAVRQQVGALSASSEQRLEQLRATVEERLERIRTDNAQQLEQMRRTVDEKLQTTLEARLGESFRQVTMQLEQVHRGLGEMQTLAAGVGDLKRVLQNVKVRGTWGEVQLGSLLEQCLAQDQYATNVATREGSGERVEFAIKLPGREAGDAPVWLPVDAKFPLDDYTRLVEAQEVADPAGAEAAARALEARIRACAQEVCGKYLDPPHTTDFAILFL